MATIQDRIKEIEEELKKTEYNKATEKHIGLLKAKMSRLEIELMSQKKGEARGLPFQSQATPRWRLWASPMWENPAS